MKDWELYIYNCRTGDLWGFLLLDYYHRIKVKDDHENPSKLIDRVIKKILTEDIDPIRFHHVL